MNMKRSDIYYYVGFFAGAIAVSIILNSMELNRLIVIVGAMAGGVAGGVLCEKLLNKNPKM